MHAALLAILVFGFAGAPKFGDVSESIPVETVTQSEFNQIMKGEKEAKAETPAPPQPAAKPPAPPTPPQPPPELRRDEEPQAPPKPAEAPPRPPKAEPPPRPAPPPSPAATEAAPPEPPERPKEAAQEKPKPEPPPKPPEPPKTTPKFDPTAIAKLINQGKPAPPSTAQASPPRGLPNQNAPRMSPSLAAALDAWFKDTYLGCWQVPPTQPDGETYVAEVRVVFNPDGSLATPPVLLNPPTDPAWRAHADSAMRAVMKCNPLRVPAQYMPYFDSWKTETIHFDPQSVQG